MLRQNRNGILHNHVLQGNCGLSLFRVHRQWDSSRKFDGIFIQRAEKNKVDDPAKIDELFKRTPGYVSWQGEHWLACCNDFCAFIGDVGTKELEELGIADDVFEEYDALDEYEDAREYRKGRLYGRIPFSMPALRQVSFMGRYRLIVNNRCSALLLQGGFFL